MANTLKGPYSPTSWFDGSTPLNMTHMNNLELQSGVSLGSFNPDLLGSGFILSGVQASRHNSYAAAVLADAPTRYYRLDEASGSTAYDLGSASQRLSYNASPTLAAASLLTGDNDTAVTFASASSQYASGTSVGGLPTGSGVATLEAWIKVSGAPAITQVILEVGDVAVANHRLCLQLTSSLTVQLTNGTVTITSAAISTGNPHHVVGTWDGTNVRLYVDGILAAGPTAATMSWSYTGNSMCVATASGATPSNWFNGTIDEAAVYTTALSSTRITAHYTAGTTATTQVDISGGTAYLVVSDGTVTRCTVTSTTETTATISSTYHLYLQPDGTFYWNTLNSPAANSLAIATVATDASGNAVGVTDARVLAPPPLFPAASEAGVATRQFIWLATNLTGTGTHDLMVFQIPATGLYRASGALYVALNGATNTVTLAVTYTPAFFAGSSIGYFLANNGGNSVGLNGSNTVNTSQDMPLEPLMFYAAAGPCQLTYRNSSGTPAGDGVYVILERVA